MTTDSSRPDRRSGPRPARVDERGRLQRVVSLLDAAAGRHVVLLADPSRPALARRWLRRCRNDRVLLVAPDTAPAWKVEKRPTVTLVRALDLEDVVDQVALLDRVDLIVDLVPTRKLPAGAASHFELFQRIFCFLRPGGAYVLHRRPGSGGSAGVDEPWDVLLKQPDPEPSTKHPAPLDALAESVRALVVSDNILLATKRHEHVLKLPEQQVDRVLAHREPTVSTSVIDSLPAGTFEVRATMRSYGPDPGDAWPRQISHPELRVRDYRGVLLSGGGMLLTAGGTLLPESFRWPYSLPLTHPGVTSVTAELGRLPRRVKAQDQWDGDYYYLDCVFDGHFGHLVTEVVPRLWGWESAKREFPELKALIHVRPRRKNKGELERKLFTAYGIGSDDIVVARTPVNLSHIVCAGPMWHNAEPHFAHPQIRETWRRITESLMDERPADAHERIFVSRGESFDDRRGCRNREDVERFFEERGFEVIFPETMSLAAQATVFANARVVAGFAGSAMFNLMHARQVEAVVVLCHNGYVARNEALYASLLGADLHYFWSEADVSADPEIPTKASLRSTWAFDFDSYGAELAEVLASY